MGMRKLRFIAAALIAGGRNPATPTAVIQWGARPEQRVVEAPLSDLADAVEKANLSNPAVVIIGEVARLRERLAWYDNRPLFGKRILVPRAALQAKDAAHAIRQRGAEPVLFPAIEIHDPPDPAPLREAARTVAGYDYVLFTSANGVERFFSELHRQGKDARAFASAKVGVIGPRTGLVLQQHGVKPDLVAEQFIGEALAEALRPFAPKRVLIPRALVARDELPELLRKQGATVDVVAAYETKPVAPEKVRTLVGQFEAKEITAVLFTSSSTVTSLCDALGSDAAKVLSNTTVSCIGPITAKTATDRGLKVDVQAAEYTLAGLLDVLELHFATATPGG
jgi:uroporphyrinogen III methyltransferase/synthase